MLRVSKEHGVNPSVAICFWCGKDNGELILAGRLPKDAEAPRKAVWNMDPCNECVEHMRHGIICISVRDGEMEKVERDHELAKAQYARKSGYFRKRNSFCYIPDPHRTGGFAVITDDAITRIVQPAELRDNILSCRWVFLPDEVWNALRLPALEMA